MVGCKKRRLVKSVKDICKDFIKDYGKFIRGKVEEGDIRYIALGVDADVDKYSELFVKTLQAALVYKDIDDTVDNGVISECVEVFKNVANKEENISIVNNYPDVVYNTCLVVYSKIREGVLLDEMQVQL